MRIVPLASESLGVRSMSTFIEAGEAKILLDAGVSLGLRASLLPHPLEYEALRRARSRIRRYAKISNLITVTHYHFDHYTPTWKEVDAKWTWSSYEEARRIYGGKLVFAKDYRSNINYSQRKRGYLFRKIASDFADIRDADSQVHQIGTTTITFSRPIPHGEDGSELGYVLCVTISHDGEKVIFCPDAQGPISEGTLSYIKSNDCKHIIVGGPPSYLAGYKVAEDTVERGFKNLEELLHDRRVVIVDHHCLRDKAGLLRVRSLKKIAAQNRSKLYTFAEYLGRGNLLLEARRKELFERHPPSTEFRNWMKSTPRSENSSLPPL